MTGIEFVQGRARRASTATERSNSVCGCTETTSHPSATSSISIFFCETAEGLGCHESRNPWASGVPRLCAKHSSAGQDRGMDRRWHHLGGRSSTCRAHQEIVRRDQPISLRLLTSETNPMTSKERSRSTKKRQTGIVRTPCVHSISPVTDLRYKSSAET